MNLHIHVGEIVLDGVRLRACETPELRTAIEELVAERVGQINCSDFADQAVEVSRFTTPANGSPRDFASGIATSITTSLQPV